MKPFDNIDLPKRFTWNSITFKWAILTSLAISMLFTVFAIVTYQTTSNVMIEQERTNFDRTMNEVTGRLSRAKDELTLSNTVFYLKESSGEYVGDSYYDRHSIETSLMELNSFISELSKPELNAKVYGLDGNLLFETKSLYLPFDVKDQKNISVQSHNNISGLMVTKPIYSNFTGKKIGYAQGFYELTSYYNVRTQILNILLILEVVGLLVSLVISYLLSSYFTSPLRKMASMLNSIEEAPKTGMRMPVPKSNDEIADLANAFNDMLERMQRFISQQQQFVEDVSHELRTPVAVIEGHINLLNRWGKDDPEVLEESLNASSQEITRMKSLVQEMLDLSRAEQSEFLYQDKESNARDVVSTTVGNFQMLYPEFIFNLDDDLGKYPDVKMYRNHFEQVLIILLDNAVKYSTDRKEILISASTSLKHVEVMVQDFGEGMTKENLKNIFNRFYRIDKARARHTGGNGLGLSIAQQLVENYNGTISVTSYPGQGSSFTFRIPLVNKDITETSSD